MMILIVSVLQCEIVAGHQGPKVLKLALCAKFKRDDLVAEYKKLNFWSLAITLTLILL